ncbi:MAG: DegQ family serine endoprotease [Nitrospirota bacterium]|nr:MAG: DegQ family serine endoprotease [Nitrospirota bacterium]
MKRSLTLIGVLFLILVGIIIGLSLSSNLDIQVNSNAQISDVSSGSSEFLDKLGTALSEISDAVKPAIVNISTEKTVKSQGNPFDHFFDDPFFKRFFGERGGPFGEPREFKSRALGSGVIVSKDGYILTNNHVVKDADEIKVLLYDKRELSGKIIGSDPKTDLAIIKIDSNDLPVLKMGNSDKLNVGSLVIAVGNPYGLSHTVTMGIVSAVGRANVGIADYEDFIQTDAAINPGNSGGALVNTKGELIGINTAIFSTTGGYQGIGFAIPSNMASNVMNSLIKHGKVVRGWLGVTIQNLTPELAKHFDIDEKEGVLISDIMDDSPADKAGLKRGDLIVEYNGKEVKDTFILRNMVAATSPGSSADLTIIRDGKKKTVNMKIGELPDNIVAAAEPAEESPLKGVSVKELTEEIRERLDISDKVNGVVIAGIEPGSIAQGVLIPGDIIQEINKKAIKSISDYNGVLSKRKSGDILLLVYRKGSYLYVTLSD